MPFQSVISFGVGLSCGAAACGDGTFSESRAEGWERSFTIGGSSLFESVTAPAWATSLVE
jgi:hypothetical protein